MKTLEELAVEYRTTGIFPKEAKIAEDMFMDAHHDYFVDQFHQHPWNDGSMSLDDFLSIQRGCWEHECGFYLTWEQAMGCKVHELQGN